MKRRPIRLYLFGPSGDKERWTIEFVPLKPEGRGKYQKTVYGDTDWMNRVVKINNRLRNPATIALTLIHEIVHVTAGQNADEILAQNIEWNYQRAIQAIRKVESPQ